MSAEQVGKAILSMNADQLTAVIEQSEVRVKEYLEAASSLGYCAAKRQDLRGGRLSDSECKHAQEEAKIFRNEAKAYRILIAALKLATS